MTGPEPKRNVAGGIAFLVIGLVILVPSGLCTGVVAGAAIVNMFASGRANMDVANIVYVALLFGGPFIAGGGALVWQGIKRLRRPRP